jgi:hypothetical protein
VVIAAIFAALVVVGALLPEPDEGGSGEKAATGRPVAKLLIKSPNQTVKSKHAYIEGTVSPSSATLNIDTKDVPLTNGRFRHRVSLRKGENSFRVAAVIGESEDYRYVTVTRKLTAAERRAEEARRRRLAAIEAERERQRKIAREQRRLQAKQNFINAAQIIPYNQLEKNPEKYSGTKVKLTGQIFQIQEDPYGGGNMLLAVTNEGYDIWDDNVWVDYSGSIKSAEDDVITVYGVVKGTKSYDTQIGGSTYVPQIRARYVEE